MAFMSKLDVMMEEDPGILSACQFVAEQASFVKIDSQRLQQLAREWVEVPWEVPGWDEEIHWRGEPLATVHYILLLDALNFCFWSDPGQPRWTVEYKGRSWNGYKALSVALGRALEEGFPLTDPATLAHLEAWQLAHILRGQGQIPMLPERLAHAREVGRVLLAQFEGDFRQAIHQAKGSGLQLAATIAREFPCFHDVSTYRGRQIPLWKRAQIAVVDLAGSLHFEGLGSFADLERLTAFADYKIPQVLRALGVLHYAPELAARVDRQELLAAGSEEEIEIRATMVWAVEWIRQAMSESGRSLKAYELDWFLWNVGQQPVADERPYHRTRTVFY